MFFFSQIGLDIHNLKKLTCSMCCFPSNFGLKTEVASLTVVKFVGCGHVGCDAM